MSKETDIDCLLKSIDYNLTDWARAEFHKWLRKKDKKISDLEAKLAESEEFLIATKWKVQDLNKQLADTETQNKRVLEKLDLIVRSNQELERKLADYEHDLDEAFKLDDIYAEKLRKRHEDYEKMKIEFAIDCMERVSQEFSMRVGISDNNIDILNDIMEEMVSILKEKK